jgi:hypothetical protein
MNHSIEAAVNRFADAESHKPIRVSSMFHPWLKQDLSSLSLSNPLPVERPDARWNECLDSSCGTPG